MKSKQQGLTMIEVLVALLVLAVGLLGMAGMQTLSMQQTQGADRRSQAVMHLQTVADELRSEKTLSATDLSRLKEELQKDLGSDATLKVDSADVGGYREATITATWKDRTSRWDQVGAGDSTDLSSHEFKLIVRYAP